MIVTTLLLLIITCVIVAYVLINKRKLKDIDKIPGPKPWPVIGNAFEFGKSTSDYLKNHMRLVDEYGPMVKIWVGSTLSLIVTDVEKVEYILSSNKHTHKSKSYRRFKNWLGQGLITSQGECWRKHRKLITPTFHFKLVEGFSEFINNNVEILVNKLKEASYKESVDIYPFINLYALDVIIESAMQTKVNAQKNSDSDYVKAVKVFLKIHIKRIFSFYLQIETIFKLTSYCTKQKKSINTLKGFTENVIRLRKNERTDDVGEKIDEFGVKRKKVFLDHLLYLQKNEGLLTDEEITNEVDTFTFAGHDTVSSAISFCLYELSKYPEIQEKLLQESNNKIGENKEEKIQFREIKEMKYLDMVFKESMRLHSPVPFIERELQSDITFDEINIPKGTIIQILIYAIHLSEKYFPEPEKFDPDRFLPENVRKRNPFTYIPFSAGARNCIGLRYARLLSKTTIIYILRNFKIHPVVPEIKPILCNNIILASENGLHVRLEPR